jgi:hypothetical protein
MDEDEPDSCPVCGGRIVIGDDEDTFDIYVEGMPVRYYCWNDDCEEDAVWEVEYATPQVESVINLIEYRKAEAKEEAEKQEEIKRAADIYLQQEWGSGIGQFRNLPADVQKEILNRSDEECQETWEAGIVDSD